MLKRHTKTDKTPKAGPYRVLVADDDPEAGRLYAKLLRREGFEVAEVGDHQVALVALANEPEPVAVLVASFSAGGTSACLKLLDAIRHHPQPTVMTTRMVLIIDTPKQQLFTWQSGADGVLLRPFTAEELASVVVAAALRPDGDRPLHRREKIDEIRERIDRRAAQLDQTPDEDWVATPH